jgi:hypothetical protein
MSNIGTPSNVYYKSEESTKSTLSLSENANQQNDYFYNYVTLGLVIEF